MAGCTRRIYAGVEMKKKKIKKIEGYVLYADYTLDGVSYYQFVNKLPKVFTSTSSTLIKKATLTIEEE